MNPSLLLPLLLIGTAAPVPASDWGAMLRQDARAFHDDIAANHVGPVDPLNPRFAALNDVGLREALQRAPRVSTYAGYRWAMRGYAARFDDGHVDLGATDKVPAVAVNWPGFLTAYDEHGVVTVRTRADDARVPLGAVLVGCDGRAAEALGRATVGAFFGRWSLASQRINQGWRLFVDGGNPFVRRPATCIFRVAGRDRRVALVWRALSDAEWPRRIGAVTRGDPAPIGTRTTGDGAHWYAISSFDGDPSSAAGKELPLLIARMKADRAALAAAPRIVLDLRGNGGGSSDWSQQIAVILWGEAAVARAGAGSSHVEWRASPANLAYMKTSWAERAGVPQPPEVRKWFMRTIAGMSASLAARRPLWREPDDDATPAAATADHAPAHPGLRGRVYVLTDSACASACLDAVDLWTAAGGIQVGAVTGADTQYMDIREDVLPSGMMRANVPMKVYRDRPRGANVPLTPRYRFGGDLRDTAAVERWIETLPGKAS